MAYYTETLLLMIVTTARIYRQCRHRSSVWAQGVEQSWYIDSDDFDNSGPRPGNCLGLSESFTLSVVDQSPVRSGGTAGDALRETIELAVATERLGYERFWVAEHHNAKNFAGTSPEILVGQIAANTSTIRVGSGGVMLSHYSSLKVAENFRVLEALYPGRIDLGVGREIL